MPDVNTVKLTREEWVNLVTLVVTDIGVAKARAVLINALGKEKAELLIDRKEGPALTKEENARIIKGLYDVAPGVDRDAKINWAISLGRKAFSSDERFQQILKYARSKVEEYESVGTIKPTKLTGEEPGFLWKPQGETTKKLVVLLPSAFTGLVKRDTLQVLSDGKLVEKGNFSSVANGNREHFRFSKAGGSYPAGSVVQVEADGYTWQWTLSKSPSQRNENLKAVRLGGNFNSSNNNSSNSRWPIAVSRIRAAMVTPIFVLKSDKDADTQLKQLANSSNFNSVCGLIDLQTGPNERQYIVDGRTPTFMSPTCSARIRKALDYGLTPILIIRNDWASRNKKPFIPSANGPSNGADFYTDLRLSNDKTFLDSIKWLYPYIHIQLSIEPDRVESAKFALELARFLRVNGFINKILINPYSDAVKAHESIKSQLDDQLVTWARSRNSGTTSVDPVFNSDGNTSINAFNADSFIKQVQSTGKDYIIWSKELANSPESIQSEYLGQLKNAPVVPEPKIPFFTWNGKDEIRLHPNLKWTRVFLVTNRKKDGSRYNWRTGEYHRLLEMHKPVPAGNIIKLNNPDAIQNEGVVQVCTETVEMYKLRGASESWCWLIRPNVPAVSYISESEWRSGKTDGVVLQHGKDG